MKPNGFNNHAAMPANVEAEQALLGGLLINNKPLAELALSPDDFSLPIHGRIFQAMREVVERGQVADPVTMKGRFDQDEALANFPGGGSGYLVELALKAITTINAPSYARQIAELRRRRELIAFAEDISLRARDRTIAIGIVERHAADAAADLKLGESTSIALLATGSVDIVTKIDWVWPGYLANGKFHILGGQKGCGKSTIVFDLFAAITVGGKFPDGSQAPLGEVFIWSGEDDIRDTILPRVLAAGGDLTRVHYPTRDKIIGGKRAFDPALDIDTLIDALRKIRGLRAVCIDPIVSASLADSHKNAETRRGLQPIVDLAIELNIVLIGVTHFTKGTQGQDPIERITGTLAFGAIPRVVLGAAKGDTEDGPRKFVRIASNIGRSGGGFEYLLHQQLLPDHDFTGQRILWGKPLTGTALELLGDGKVQSQKLAAITFLNDQLAGGVRVKVTELKSAAEAHGVSWRTIERVKTDEFENIVAEQEKPEGEEKRAWYWRKDVGGLRP
jgi:hypothetical protein